MRARSAAFSMASSGGYDLQLTRYDEKGLRATFYTTGMEHSPTSASGTGWERTRWRATQRAASMPASTGEEVAPSAPGPAFLAGFAYAIGATPRGSSKSPLGSDAR